MPLPPKSNTAYDPAKAASYNQLRQQGLSENQARQQAGITNEEKKHYMVNEVGSNDPKDASYNPNYGKMGPQVSGENFNTYNKAIASGKTEQQAYAELQQKNQQSASDREFIAQEKAFLDGKQGKPGTSDDTSNNEEFDRADMPINAKTPPGTKVITQTTETTSVSGGGSVTRIAGQKVDTPASIEAQKKADAKQAELDKFYDDNPDPQERAAAGMPPLSAQEEAARKAKLRELSDQKTALENQATDLKASTPGSTIPTPNTNTSDTTTTYERSSANTPVSAPTGADPVVNQQAGTQLVNNYTPAGSIQSSANNVNVIPGGGQITDPNAPDYNATYAEYVAERDAVQNSAPPAQDIQSAPAVVSQAPSVENAQPAAQQVETFNEGQSTITTVSQPEATTGYYETGGGGGTQGTITKVSAEATPVDDNTLPTGGNQSTVNIGTDENRGGNLEKATLDRAKEQNALQTRFNQPSNGDWRVRIRLAPNSNYLYNDVDPGILAPLKASDGVIFPYTPSIQTTYNANYDVTDLVHSNYRGQFYKNSNVGDINITGMFTAQDTAEAEYLLAVIHFFRTATKMFYGQDAQRGAPPPLVYLFGLGQYQFNNQPCVIRTFTYNLPSDVDYVRTQPNNYGSNLLNRRTKTVSAPANTIGSVIGRLGHAVDLLGNFLKPGALPGLGTSPAGQPGVAQQAVYNTSNATYVPTKIEIQLSLLPIQTRNQVSQQFSLKGFAKGDLLRGGFW